MNPDQVNELISAVGGLLNAILWPTLVGIVAFRFGPAVMRKFIESDQVTFKAGGLEASFLQGKVQLAANLVAAVNDKSAGAQSGSEVDAKDIADDVEHAIPDVSAFERIRGSRLLWVDDRPGNNFYERRALEALGIHIETSLDTDDALQQLQARHYDLVISDMGRPGDSRAGYTLLDALRQASDRTPLVIYAGSRTPEHVREAQSHGAVGCTNSPQELILLATATLSARHETWATRRR
ncbi:CheY-like chemotaxis protein [Pseudarthrobacter oxydans]|uniref:response regulator n=1 Tax=Pseudarthrobacter oxydans TaxID=1671 RepID=UPI00278383BA|nr:response regulator [Pseudarthrobacter oxydans]MDP9984846.1 CheY-like chemotaxis protein [Pseudarthrobacter oxydans]